MGLSIEQSKIVIQKLIDKHQDTLANHERMVLTWAKELIAHADQGYWRGVEDGMAYWRDQEFGAKADGKS